MNYQYGRKAEEIDEFFAEKKSWSTVKDKILEDYIVTYLKTVPQLQKPILIVDAFSGPGRFGDGTPGSPVLICEAIAKKNVSARCLFADSRLGHRNALEVVLAEHIRSGLCEKPYSDCAAVIDRSLRVGQDSTVFYYLDPYGIKDLDFEMIRKVCARSSRESTEILINFNFRTFMRMSGNWNYTDSAETVEEKVKAGKTETVDAVMGGDYWRRIVTDPSVDTLTREDAVISAYIERLGQLLKHVVSVPVKEPDEDNPELPADELAHYHLIFGTRSPRAVQYMNDVGSNALEPYFAQFRERALFDVTPERYLPASREQAKDAIVQLVHRAPKTRPQIYDGIIPKFFMDYLVKDYRKMIDELVFTEGRLHPNRSTMKKKSQLNNETLLSVRPWPSREDIR